MSYASAACRRPIKMSPVCQLEMTLPGDFPGVWGDGSADEQWRAAAARGAARFESATASAVSDQVAPCSPPPNPAPIKGEGLNHHSRWYSRPLDGRAVRGKPAVTAKVELQPYFSSWPGLSRPSTSFGPEMEAWIPGTRPGKTISGRLQHRRNTDKLYQHFPRTSLPRWRRVGVGVTAPRPRGPPHQHWFMSPPPESPPLKSWSEL